MKRKPLGWPKYMTAKRLSSGLVGYYWAPPTWAIKDGCPLKREALGTDYAAAKERCDTFLNPTFRDWRTGVDDQKTITNTGTFDWLVVEYEKSPKYLDCSPRTQKVYAWQLRTVRDYRLSKDAQKRRVGDLQVAQIQPNFVDRVYEALKISPEGHQRLSTASKCMIACRVAWNVCHRKHPTIVPKANPFSKMDLKKTGIANIPANREQMLRFVAAADKMGHPSMGTAAMVAFEWLQREADVIGTLAWGHYRPANKPHAVKVRHSKTDETIWLPLETVDGDRKVYLYPELEERLASATRRGPLIIMRDRKDKKRKEYLRYQESWFQHLARKIMDTAELPKELTFTSFRHGGMTELGDAELTDQEMMALSAHKQRSMLTVYSKRTEKQRTAGARKRLSMRTKRDDLSE